MSCCICESSLDNSKGKKRHKKLNGSTFVTERSTLAKCVEAKCGINIDDIGLMDPRCVVCYQCTNILGKISKYNQDIETLSDQVVKNFVQYKAQNNITQKENHSKNHKPVHESTGEKAPKQRKVTVRFILQWG